MNKPTEPKYSYDKEADIIYLDLEDGEYSHSVHLNETSLSRGDEIDSYIMLDFSVDGKLLGIEVQHATKAYQLSQRRLSKLVPSIPLHLLATLGRGVAPTPAK